MHELFCGLLPSSVGFKCLQQLRGWKVSHHCWGNCFSKLHELYSRLLFSLNWENVSVHFNLRRGNLLLKRLIRVHELCSRLLCNNNWKDLSVYFNM